MTTETPAEILGRAAAKLREHTDPVGYLGQLADWLDAVADEAESHAAHGYGNEEAEVTDGHPMAVALAILKEAS